MTRLAEKVCLITGTGIARAAAELFAREGASVAIVDIARAEARALDVPMRTLEQAARVWHFAASQGAGRRDMTELVRVMEDWAGVELRSRAP